MSDDPRWCQRRRVYLGEALTFELLCGAARLEAEAIDLTSDGLGLAVVDPAAAVPAVGDAVTVRYTGRGASGAVQEALVRHVGCVRGAVPRIGLSLASGASGDDHRRYPCPDALPAFATAACPWFFQETLCFRILEV